jgi:radical SAM superfamily enzyme YgiQ (UPF0313 family)
MDTLIPPNLAIISACLRKAGIDVSLFDTTFYRTRDITGDEKRVETLQVKETDFSEYGIFYKETDMVEDFKEKVNEYQPNLIGLSAVSPTYKDGIRLLQSIKDKKIPTIIGGVHATVYQEKVLEEDCVDMICIGEGEEALVELCKKMQNNENIYDTKNIWFKKDNEIIKNPLRELVNLEELPFQDWSIFHEHRRLKPMGGKIRKTACIELNRYCPYNCTYCTNEFFHKMYNYKNYREKSIKRFIEEVKYLKEKYDIQYIYMSAESFLSTSSKRFDEFIREYGKIKIPFWMECRPESITVERIEKLKSVGCESMNVGVESGDEEFRRTVLNRKMTNQQIINGIKTVKMFDIRIGANVIIGFPTETREQIFKTIELIIKSDPDNTMIHPFNPYYGTKLYEVCVEKKYIDKDVLGGDYRVDYVLDMPQLKKEEIMGLYRTFNLYVKFPKCIWKEIEKAEKFNAEGNEVFKRLSNIYKEKYLRGSK